MKLSPARIWIVVVVLLCGLRSSRQDRAEEPPPGAPPQAAKVTSLHLSPAAEPANALQYTLFPDESLQREGNAAVLYERAVLGFRTIRGRDGNGLDMNHIEALRTASADEFPSAEVAQLLDQYAVVFEDIGRASLRRDCKWEYPFGENVNPYGVLLPELSDLRDIAMLLAVKARKEIVANDFDKALETMRIGFAMARHMTTQNCTMIHTLVAFKICDRMYEQIEFFMARPGAPNLYWALTALPHPLISVRAAMNLEISAVLQFLPELRDPLDKSISDETWETFLPRVRELLSLIGVSPEANLPTWGSRGYFLAKEKLIEAGWKEDELTSFPVGKVIAIHSSKSLRELQSRVFKWTFIPADELHQVDRSKTQPLPSDFENESIPLGRALLPALESVQNGRMEGAQRLAILRTIEALRLHAAAHDGRLPGKLSQVDLVPVPKDPVTGEPFLYDVAESSATLEAANAAAPSGPPGRTFQLQIR